MYQSNLNTKENQKSEIRNRTKSTARSIAKSKKGQSGFSLIELLVIMAVVAIVLSIATVAWKGYYQKLQFAESVQVFVQELYRTRSDARRSSDNITLTWDAATKQLLTQNSASESLRTKTLPGKNITITTGDGNITYTAPFGRISNDTDQYIRLEDSKGNIRDILIIGITGKIYQRKL